MKTPLTKIELIQRSLSCFVSGLVGLVPVLGFPFSCGAILDYWYVSRRKGSLWNPASRYLKWGLATGWIGLLISAIIGAIIANAIWNAMIG